MVRVQCRLLKVVEYVGTTKKYIFQPRDAITPSEGEHACNTGSVVGHTIALVIDKREAQSQFTIGETYDFDINPSPIHVKDARR